jgi:ferrous iron transport protein A
VYKDHTEPNLSNLLDYTVQPLSILKPGAKATVLSVHCIFADNDIERQLLEIGFVEGAQIEVLHQGLFADPIAVRIEGRLLIALRRSEANFILVMPYAS